MFVSTQYQLESTPKCLNPDHRYRHPPYFHLQIDIKGFFTMRKKQTNRQPSVDTVCEGVNMMALDGDQLPQVDGGGFLIGL